jgi:hypothetical protein
VEVTHFLGSARETGDGQQPPFNPHEPQIFISDADECGGTRVPTVEFDLDVYAYALINGAVPGTYPIGNTANPPAFATFWINGISDWNNDPQGSLTVSEIDATATVGDFDVSMSTLDGGTLEISGSFVAPLCPP